MIYNLVFDSDNLVFDGDNLVIEIEDEEEEEGSIVIFRFTKTSSS